MEKIMGHFITNDDIDDNDDNEKETDFFEFYTPYHKL